MAESKPYGYSWKTDPKQPGTKPEWSDSISQAYLDSYDYGTSTEKLFAPVATRGQATSVAAGSGFTTITWTQSFTTGFEPSYVRITANDGSKSFSIGTCKRSAYIQSCMNFSPTATWAISNFADRTAYVTNNSGSSATWSVSFSSDWFSIWWIVTSTTVQYQWEAFA